MKDLLHIKERNLALQNRNNEMFKVGAIINVDLEKGKKMPIGTISNGYKKLAEGKWVKSSDKDSPNAPTRKESKPIDKKISSKENLNSSQIRMKYLQQAFKAKNKKKSEASRLSLHVEYQSERSGEPVFELRGKRFQYVNAKYPNGKKDIGIYDFASDMTYGYAAFREMMNLDSQGDGRLNKSIEDSLAILNVDLSKGKEVPIGTVTNGRKKVAKNKWVPVKKTTDRANGHTKSEDKSSKGKMMSVSVEDMRSVMENGHLKDSVSKLPSSGNVSVVKVKRDISGMRGSQDKYEMKIMDGDREIASLGSHPSDSLSHGVAGLDANGKLSKFHHEKVANNARRKAWDSARESIMDKIGMEPTSKQIKDHMASSNNIQKSITPQDDLDLLIKGKAPLTGGQWKTINGAKVYMKGDKVVAGAEGKLGGDTDSKSSSNNFNEGGYSDKELNDGTASRGKRLSDKKKSLSNMVAKVKSGKQDAKIILPSLKENLKSSKEFSVMLGMKNPSNMNADERDSHEKKRVNAKKTYQLYQDAIQEIENHTKTGQFSPKEDSTKKDLNTHKKQAQEFSKPIREGDANPDRFKNGAYKTSVGYKNLPKDLKQTVDMLNDLKNSNNPKLKNAIADIRSELPSAQEVYNEKEFSKDYYDVSERRAEKQRVTYANLWQEKTGHSYDSKSNPSVEDIMDAIRAGIIKPEGHSDSEDEARVAFMKVVKEVHSEDIKSKDPNQLRLFKSFEADLDLLIKGKKTGYYQDDAKNRKAGVVGQKYSKDKEQDNPKSKGAKDDGDKKTSSSNGEEGQVTGHDVAHLTHMKQLVESGDNAKAYEIYNTLPPEAQDKVPQDVVNVMVGDHHTEEKDDTWDSAGKSEKKESKKDTEKNKSNTEFNFSDDKKSFQESISRARRVHDDLKSAIQDGDDALSAIDYSKEEAQEKVEKIKRYLTEAISYKKKMGKDWGGDDKELKKDIKKSIEDDLKLLGV